MKVRKFGKLRWATFPTLPFLCLVSLPSCSNPASFLGESETEVWSAMAWKANYFDYCDYIFFTTGGIDYTLHYDAKTRCIDREQSLKAKKTRKSDFDSLKEGTKSSPSLPRSAFLTAAQPPAPSRWISFWARMRCAFTFPRKAMGFFTYAFCHKGSAMGKSQGLFSS